jgi:chromate transport protein ChrA
MSWSEVLIVFLRAAFLSTSGNAVLALLEQDLVVRLHVLTRSEFALGVAVGAATPGPLGYGCIALGFLADGWRGATVAMLTSWMPPLLAIPLRSGMRRLEGRRWMTGVLWGLQSAGAGLLLALAVGMTKDAVTGWQEGLLAAGAMVLLFRKVHPGVVLALAAGVGALFLR